MAATIGLISYLVLGSGYLSGGIAMVLTIILTIILDVVHPAAVPTSDSFAFRVGIENNWVVFGLAVGIIALLVVLERFALWILARYS